MSAADWALVGDIGATNARFALVPPDGGLVSPQALLCDDYPTIEEAITAYLAQTNANAPVQAVLAVAAAPSGDTIAMTNHPWTFSIERLRAALGMRRLRVVNDFHANAAAIPHLRDDERVQVGSGTPVAGAPIGIIGPGTGLGVSTLIVTNSEPLIIPGEGGHVTMPAADAREAAVLDLMRTRFDHVSAERLLSGPGLVNLYNALCELDRVPAAAHSPAQVTDPQTGGEDAHAREATEMFCAMLGTVAGNLALTLGTRGGIYIAGGIVPKLGDAFAHSQFRARFEAKGRFAGYLAAIPTYIMVQKYAALIGASKLLEPV